MQVSPQRRRLITGLLVLTTLPLLPALGSWWWHREALAEFRDESANSIPTLSLHDLNQLAGPKLWIDARSESEFGAQHIPGAIKLTETQWEEQLQGVLERWTPESWIVVYCSDQRCGSSQRVAKRLHRQTQWPNLVILQGGWNAWLATQPPAPTSAPDVGSP